MSEITATEALAEIERLNRVVANYEHRIVWDTTCENCANILDRSIADYERAERFAAAAAVAALSAAVDRRTTTNAREQEAQRWAAVIESTIADPDAVAKHNAAIWDEGYDAGAHDEACSWRATPDETVTSELNPYRTK